MNRLPQESHCPTKSPSSPVENRSGAPHLRQGRPRDVSESNRPGRSPSSRGGPRFGTKIVVVSHSGQVTSREPWPPSRTDNGEPHSSHSGFPAAASSIPSSGSGPVAPPAGGDPKRPETVAPSTNANSFAHDGQTPVRSRTSCCSNSIDSPHSGQELVIVLENGSDQAHITFP